jgi:hypothetical protein
MGLIYKNLCLVCGEVLELSELETHLNMNYGHAAVEVMLREDNIPDKIAINNRIPGVKVEWEDQCASINAFIKDFGSEVFSVDTISNNWIEQRKRIRFKNSFPSIPDVAIKDYNYIHTAGLKISSITTEYFDVEFSSKRISDKIPSVLKFNWEATNDGN